MRDRSVQKFRLATLLICGVLLSTAALIITVTSSWENRYVSQADTESYTLVKDSSGQLRLVWRR